LVPKQLFWNPSLFKIKYPEQTFKNGIITIFKDSVNYLLTVSAAAIKSRNNGCGLSGLDWNSG